MAHGRAAVSEGTEESERRFFASRQIMAEEVAEMLGGDENDWDEAEALGPDNRNWFCYWEREVMAAKAAAQKKITQKLIKSPTPKLMARPKPKLMARPMVKRLMVHY